MKKRMPSKEEIERRAVELYMAENWRISDITPERHELQEEGFIRRAQHELMGTEIGSQGEMSYHTSKSEMRGYLETMASEMRLVILEKREHRRQERKVRAFDVFREKHPSRVVKTNGYRITIPAIPTPKLTKKTLMKKIRKASATKGVAHIEKDLNIKTNFRGNILDKKAKKTLGSLIREGKVYTPKHSFLKPTDVPILKTPKPVSRPGRKKKKKVKPKRARTMRSIRKIKGVKIFSFPDDVWKVRKP